LPSLIHREYGVRNGGEFLARSDIV
jgi:hypothetical protein